MEKDKRPWTPDLAYALKHLGLHAASLASAVEHYSKGVIEPNAEGAPSRESAAHMNLRPMEKQAENIAAYLDECYAHLGYPSLFTKWLKEWNNSGKQS